MSFGGASGDAAPAAFKSFVSEDEIAEKRRVRQEEWEKVRKPEDPIEAPEEVIDHRSLYDRLQEQKDKKQEEYDEAHKLKNQVKGLDEDESHFLDFVSKRQQDVEREREKETDSVLLEYRESVVSRTESASKASSSSSKPEKKLPTLGKKSQTALLAGAIKRKSTAETTDDSKKAKQNHSQSGAALGIEIQGVTATSHEVKGQTAEVIGVLPGIGTYTDSENSDSSSGSEDIDTDLFVSGKGAFLVKAASSQGHCH